MSNLSKLEFVVLDIFEKNYLSRVLDAEIHLAAKGLGDTIARVGYLTVKDPFELWTGLKESIIPFLLKNHEARPTGSAPLPKANIVARRDKSGKRQNNYHGHMNIRGHGNGKRRYNNHHRGGHGKQENNMGSQNNLLRGKNSNCHRCGMNGH
ncbi:uncharacterized protein [Nicotiana sylvestris]|uniref:uncharacterized protein n=1 Tax=Nicotiana sylvestris TaxID=4096 RepID=UPI00388CCE97